MAKKVACSHLSTPSKLAGDGRWLWEDSQHSTPNHSSAKTRQSKGDKKKRGSCIVCGVITTGPNSKQHSRPACKAIDKHGPAR